MQQAISQFSLPWSNTGSDVSTGIAHIISGLWQCCTLRSSCLVEFFCTLWFSPSKWYRKLFKGNSNGQVVPVYATKAYVGLEVQLQAVLNSTLDRCKLSVSRPVRFTPDERAACTELIEVGWASEPVWISGRKENTSPYWESNHDSSAIHYANLVPARG